MEKATIYDYARICKTFNGRCKECPLHQLHNGKNTLCSILLTACTDKANEIILNWCKEHPVETRQDRFLKMFPNAATNGKGRLSICPKNIDENYGCELEPNSCVECMDNYWLAEVDENE